MENEKLCLKWNDFQTNLQTSFQELRGDTDFTDVTLACEDQSLQAHKVILSASSPFFKKLFKVHKHPQPLIYMRGIKSSELIAMIDFIYLGEASIFQEQLESFLALAEELELDGLTGSSEEASPEKPNYSNKPDKSSNPDQQRINLNNTQKGVISKVKHEGNPYEGMLMPTKQQSKQTVHIDPATVAVIESMIERREDGSFACNQCEYTSKKGHKDHMREHVEKHIEGLEYPCNYCNKVLRSSNAFRSHQQKTRTCYKDYQSC